MIRFRILIGFRDIESTTNNTRKLLSPECFGIRKMASRDFYSDLIFAFPDDVEPVLGRRVHDEQAFRKKPGLDVDPPANLSLIFFFIESEVVHGRGVGEERIRLPFS